jgi:hypothetical protein
VFVLQIVCGISAMVMGTVALIEERGQMNLGLGVPAGTSSPHLDPINTQSQCLQIIYSARSPLSFPTIAIRFDGGRKQ